MAVVVDVADHENARRDHGPEDQPADRAGASASRFRPRHPVSTFVLCAAAVLVPIGVAAVLVALLG